MGARGGSKSLRDRDIIAWYHRSLFAGGTAVDSLLYEAETKPVGMKSDGNDGTIPLKWTIREIKEEMREEIK